MKRNLILFALIGITMFLLASLSFAKDQDAPITGTWDCQSKGGQSANTSFTLFLQQTGENVEGNVSSPMGDAPISYASFKQGTLEIHIDTSEGNYVLIAKLTEGKLSGNWSADTDKGTWEGKKEAAETK